MLNLDSRLVVGAAAAVVGCEKRELGFIECMMRVAAKMFVHI